MDYYKKAKAIMDKDATDFVGGVSENEIDNAMKSLSVTFPDSYQAFLADFGGGDAGGEIIFGITGNEEDDMIMITQSERAQGMPQELVIIGFWNDTLVGLDTGKMDEGECPIVEINDDHHETTIIADTFGKFLYDYLQDE